MGSDPIVTSLLLSRLLFYDVIHLKRTFILLTLSFALTACGLSMPKIPKLSMPSFKIPRVYKMTIQQGNVITQEMVDQLKPGMNRSQVAFVMGEPILQNTFDQDRWEYIYTINIPGFFEQQIQMTLYFEDEVLAYFTGDLAPTSATEDETVSSESEETAET